MTSALWRAICAEERRQHRKPHSALSTYMTPVGWIALRKNRGLRFVLDALQCHAGSVDEISGCERRCALGFVHSRSPLPGQGADWTQFVRRKAASTDRHESVVLANRKRPPACALHLPESSGDLFPIGNAIIVPANES
jgi:hypothetical protein